MAKEKEGDAITIHRVEKPKDKKAINAGEQ